MKIQSQSIQWMFYNLIRNHFLVVSSGNRDDGLERCIKVSSAEEERQNRPSLETPTGLSTGSEV